VVAAAGGVDEQALAAWRDGDHPGASDCSRCGFVDPAPQRRASPLPANVTVDEHVVDVDVRLVELVPRARRHIGQGTRR
jgi:hypothetical protein